MMHTCSRLALLQVCGDGVSCTPPEFLFAVDPKTEATSAFRIDALPVPGDISTINPHIGSLLSCKILR